MGRKCMAVNPKGRTCRGELELYYESPGGRKFWKCDEWDHIWTYSAGMFEQFGGEVGWLKRQAFKFRRWREEKAGQPFVETLKDIGSMFLNFLPSWPFGGGTRSFAPSSSNKDFEKLKPREHFISKARRKEPEPKDKPSVKEVLDYE